MTNEALVIRIKAGIDVADNMLLLWQQNQGFIGQIANKYKHLAEEDDLLQEGYLGLCKAVDGYDPDQGVKFLTYAKHWIQQKMLRYIHNNGTVRIPVHEQVTLSQYKKLVDAFVTQIGREPTDREIGYYLGLSGKQVAQLKKDAVMANIGSLDVPVGEDGDSSMYDLLPGQESPEDEAVEKVQQEQLKETLWGMVDALPGCQPAVLRLRFQEGKTLKEAGEQIGTTIEGVRQWQNKALRELRKPDKLRVLHPYMYGTIYSRALRGNGVSHFNHTWTSSTEYTALGLMGEW